MNTIKSNIVPASETSYFYFVIHLPGKQHRPNQRGRHSHEEGGNKRKIFPTCPKVSWHLGQQRPSVLCSVCCCLSTEPAKCAAEPKRAAVVGKGEGSWLWMHSYPWTNTTAAQWCCFSADGPKWEKAVGLKSTVPSALKFNTCEGISCTFQVCTWTKVQIRDCWCLVWIFTADLMSWRCDVPLYGSSNHSKTTAYSKVNAAKHFEPKRWH